MWDFTGWLTEMMKKDLFDPHHLAFLWQKQEESQEKVKEERGEEAHKKEASLEEEVSAWCELLKEKLSSKEWETLLPYLEQLLEWSYAEEKEENAQQALVLLEEIEDLLMSFALQRLQKSG